MIYYDYEIWTDAGWFGIRELNSHTKVMVFNNNNRMSKFKEVGEIKSKIVKNNFVLSNSNYNIILCNQNNFLTDKYHIRKVDLNNTEANKLLINAGTVFIANYVEELEKDCKYITFDLGKDEFVYIKNVMPFYLGWDKIEIENKKIKKMKTHS